MKMERRDFIKYCVVSGVISSAGCVSNGTPPKNKLEELGPVTIENQTPEQQKIRMKIEADGKEVYHEDYILSPQRENSSEKKLYNWEENNKALEWTVSAKLNSSEWESESFRADRTPYCHVVEIRVRERDFDPLIIVVHDCAAITESTV